MTGLYVYAVAGSSVRLRARGIFGRPVRSVAVGRLHAIVESAGRAPKPSLARLKAQGRVLETLVQRRVDLLPARFGTFVSDTQELEHALRSRAATLQKALRRVRGCVQMTLRIRRDRNERPVPSREPVTGGAGTAYLVARTARATEVRHDPAVRAFTSTTKRMVRATRVESSESTTVVFHLVPRKKVGRYVAAVVETAARKGALVAVTGPFAPFAFVDTE